MHEINLNQVHEILAWTILYFIQCDKCSTNFLQIQNQHLCSVLLNHKYVEVVYKMRSAKWYSVESI